MAETLFGFNRSVRTGQWQARLAASKNRCHRCPLHMAIRIMLAKYHFILLKCRNSLKPIRKYIKNHVRKYNV